jgi:hypothetical protein
LHIFRLRVRSCHTGNCVPFYSSRPPSTSDIISRSPVLFENVVSISIFSCRGVNGIGITELLVEQSNINFTLFFTMLHCLCFHSLPSPEFRPTAMNAITDFLQWEARRQCDLCYARAKTKFSENGEENIKILTTALLEGPAKDFNNVLMPWSEWYSWHFRASSIAF